MKDLVSTSVWSQKVVKYRFYRLIYKSQRYNDVVQSEKQNVHKKIAAQKQDQAFNGSDSISVIKILTEFKQAYNSSRIRKAVAAWPLRDYMTGPALSTVKVRLILPSNYQSIHEGSIKTYTEVVNSLLKRYATDNVFAIAN